MFDRSDRVRGTRTAFMTESGTGWSAGRLSAVFDVAVCDVEQGPAIEIYLGSASR